MTKKRITRSINVDHVARIEGKAAIDVTIEKGEVTVAEMNIFEGPRYFEAITLGKSVEDATAVFPRVCSFCAAAHKITGVQAAENAIGLEVSEQTRKLRELLYIGDYIESHALHLFLLALPDFLDYPDAFSMGEEHPKVLQAGMRLKDIGADIQTVIGSRYIHQENVLMGGFGKLPSKKDLGSLSRRLKYLRNDAEEALETFVSYRPWPESEMPRIHLALEPYDGTYTLMGDTVHASDGTQFNAAAYRMRIDESVVPHSFAKHCHYNEQPFMTGAISRYTLFSGGMTGRAKELAQLYSEYLDPSNPLSNNFAQAIELVYFIHKALDITTDLSNALKENEQRIHPEFGSSGTGVSMTEAPRGMLAYTIAVDKAGLVKNVDIITPTAMFLPLMEADLKKTTEGMLEHGISDEKEIAQRLETIVRSYDPCVSCSVHVAKVK